MRYWLILLIFCFGIIWGCEKSRTDSENGGQTNFLLRGTVRANGARVSGAYIELGYFYPDNPSAVYFDNNFCCKTTGSNGEYKITIKEGGVFGKDYKVHAKYGRVWSSWYYGTIQAGTYTRDFNF